MFSLVLLGAQLLIAASSTSATCGRKTLSMQTQNFWFGAIGKSDPANPQGLKLAKDVKISQNNVIVPSLKETIYTTTTGIATGYQIEAFDTVTCETSTLVVLKHGSETSITSLRMKTNQEKMENNTITEIEILHALKGSHQFFAPEAYPEAAPPEFMDMEQEKMDKGPQPGIRADLLKVAETYPEGIQTGDSKVVLAGATCPRRENGNQTTEHCNENMDLFKWPVTDRRWVVDTRIGVVMGSFFFHYKDGKGKLSATKDRGPDSKTGLWLHEYFKIDHGKIISISAALKTLEADYKDVWATK